MNASLGSQKKEDINLELKAFKFDHFETQDILKEYG